MAEPLNRPPYGAKPGGREWTLWFNQLIKRVAGVGQILWTQIDKTDSNLTDLATRNHSDLQNIGTADDTSADTVKDKHVSNAMMKAIPDHTGATSAHGASGNIVGETDWATALVGGVVKLAAAVADLVVSAVTDSASTVSVTSADATDLATVITLANEMKADVNSLVTDHNDLVTKYNTAQADIIALKDKINALMASERTAGQLAP